jgi:uncharacterized ferritin-like protein (DUF455 family)
VELRQWAERILRGDTLEEKLLDPGPWTDHSPGSPLFWEEPTRPPHMAFKRHNRKEILPTLSELHSSEKRAICLHRFAGHELLAVEIMAYALLAFPEAPRGFRFGVAYTLKEEQEHVRLYIKRLEALGLKFGDLPLYRHFWNATPHLKDPLQYISVMSLTFEMANLDFAPIYGAAFAGHGDGESAELMKRILEDEIGHVSFGWNWLKKWQGPAKTLWETWAGALPPKMDVTRARGPQFFAEHRRLAGIGEEWIERFQKNVN